MAPYLSTTPQPIKMATPYTGPAISVAIPTVNSNTSGLVGTGNQQSSLYTNKTNPVFSATPSNPSATSAPQVGVSSPSSLPKNPSLGTPAAQQYMGNLASNQVNIGTTQNPNIQTNGQSLTASPYQPTNGISQQQAQQGYSTIPGAFNPVTGAQTSPLPNTPSALGTSGTQNQNVQQLDPITGLPVSPTANPQMDQAYQTYLQSIQLQNPVTDLQAQLSKENAAINPQLSAIGRQPILSGFASNEQQGALLNDQAQIQSTTAELQQAQSLQNTQQQAAQAGLSYQQFLQSQAQAKQIAQQPITAAYGQTVFNPATGQYSNGGNVTLSGQPATDTSSLATAVANGSIDYNTAFTQLSNAYGGAVANQLLGTIQKNDPSFNVNTSIGQGSAAQSNANTAGTAQQQAALSAYVQSYPAVQTLNQNLNNITSLGNMTVQNAAGNNINPFAAAPANATLASIKTGLSNTGQVTFNSNITALQQAIQALYAGSGGNTPAGVQTAIGQMADGSLSVSGLQALLTAAESEGSAKLANATSTATSEYQLTQGKSNTSNSTTSTGGWASLGD